jgi:hypothetical protein
VKAEADGSAWLLSNNQTEASSPLISFATVTGAERWRNIKLGS